MRWMVGIGLGIAALVLIVICLFGSWFNLQGSGTAMGLPVSADIDYGLRGISAKSTASGISVRVSMDYSDVPGTGGTDFIGVLTLTQALVLLALVFMLLMVILGFLVGLGKMRDRSCVAVGALAVVFTLTAFAYFFVAFPSAMNEDPPTPGMGTVPTISGLWGSGSMDMNIPGYGTVSLDMVWGPGYAWYLMIVAFFCALAGTLLMIGSGKKEVEAPFMHPYDTPDHQYGYQIQEYPEKEETVERPSEDHSEQIRLKK